MARLELISTQFRYRIVRQLYEGGMGVVYEAEQEGARGFLKRVAIKVIRDHFARQPEFIENFIGEARLVSDLIHTNIVQTYHLGETEGAFFISMELIRGVNLEQFLERLRVTGRRLPVELAVFIVSRVARGLAYAHAKTDAQGGHLGIVHRDVNPKNIMMAYEGDVKLTDFGIAKARGFLASREGDEVAGKPEYMSPEQADFQVTDRRSDLFSAGVVLTELILGSNPFRGRSAEESQKNVIAAAIPDLAAACPGIEPRLEAIVRRCLQRDPADRYQTADELLYELEFLIYHKGYGPTNETLGRFLREVFPVESLPGTSKKGPTGTLKVTPLPPGTRPTQSATRTATRKIPAKKGSGAGKSSGPGMITRIRSRLKSS